MSVKAAHKTLVKLTTGGRTMGLCTMIDSSDAIMCIGNLKDLGRNSQNFLRKFLIFFVTLGLKILGL